jgi:hypothetical protein
MITKLTKEQEELLPVIRDYWIKIGLSTEPCNFELSKLAAIEAYQCAGLKPASKFYLFDCPVSAAEGVVQLGCMDRVRHLVSHQVSHQVWHQVWHQVRHQVSHQVYNQVRDQISNQVYNQVKDQISKQVWEQVWNQVSEQIYNQVRDQISNQVWEQVWNQVCSGYDTAWLASYDFFHKAKLVDCSKLNGLFKLAHHCGWWTPYKDICIFQHRPEKISLTNGLLHCDGSAAVRYRNGFSVWALNGVRVPQWLAETKAEEIDPRKLLKLDNAQVRAEFVRKVGIERICYKLKAKTVDSRTITISGKQHKYDLLKLKFGDFVYSYLRMENPSVPELWHIEGVPNECCDVWSALNFRNGFMEADIDDVNGVDWYQQGDVLLKPVGAKKFKRFPKILT